MRTTNTSRRGLMALFITAALLLPCTHAAFADTLADAQYAYDAGRNDEARAHLERWLDGGKHDAPQLLRAVQIARRIQDLDLLGALRGTGEDLEEKAGDAASEPLHLALGFAYLGLAEESLRRRTGGSSVSLYFADALARAERVAIGGANGAIALRLTAETYYAKGDSPSALRTIESRMSELASGPDAKLHAVHGALRYERGVAAGTDATGRPTESARADLNAAAKALKAAVDADVLRGAQLRRVHLRHAWAQHRLGNFDPAIESYQAAYASGTRQGTLAVRGMSSLLGRDTKRLALELGKLMERHPADAEPADALFNLHLRSGDHARAMLVAHARLERTPEDAAARYQVGLALRAAGQPENAKHWFTATLAMEPDHLQASFAIEQLARSHLSTSPERTMAIYEELLKLRPSSPYIRNNYGFILRDLVTPHTDVARTGIQRIKVGAPDRVRKMLQRCVEVYAEAAALIDPKYDDSREELEAWNLAGIVNDYGLILHYFLDVQDAELAERQYLRALRMTDHGFKDTYSPNLQRLYAYVLTDRSWRWYRLAREARDAIMRETRDAQGRLVLVGDDAKRAAAGRDMVAARARILQTLEMDADEDGLPWPPGKETGNDR
ncbi:MAG: hypothetical protein QNJ90_07980 [Planctomycetota bacterium]|nr:hypothetical protein [Planctomycetota bacterium]